MASDFEMLVGALWADLGLGAPPRGGMPARLMVDGQSIGVALSPDERSVVVTAEVGALADDPVRSAEQLRRLLRDGAGAILHHAAAAKVARGAAGGRHAVVEAVCPCQRGGTAALSRAIEDVLAVADLHRPAVSGAPAAAPSRAPVAVPDDHLIFRL